MQMMIGNAAWTMRRRKPIAVFALAFALASGGCIVHASDDLNAALTAAKTNRVELEQVIRHYETLGDTQKLAAARFLIGNMEGHEQIIFALYDTNKQEIPFDALAYRGLGEAQAELDALEKKHGPVDFKPKQSIPDLETVKADYLIENIDLAFLAWRTKPWAKNLTQEAFFEHILAYRSGREPLDSWRSACLQRYGWVPGKMKNPTDLQEAANLVMGDVNGWIGFNDLYYVHPNDQSFSEMTASRRGRCGDIANMTGYALRANAIPSAADYTPFWADRDNNHAWTVILNEKGEGRAGLFHRAAKVYRKTYAHQAGNLAFQLRPGEQAPRWLSGKAYADVTTQYMDTTDVTVELTNEVPPEARFAYLCVFNGGEWQAIHWGRIDGRRVTFSNMGRNICYLPAYYVHEKLMPAGSPLILEKNGNIQTLKGGGEAPKVTQISATAPALISPDTHVVTPVAQLNKGKKYELFVWQNGWQSLAKVEAAEATSKLDQVREGQLYWMVEEGSHKLERIFTVRDGQQVWW